MAAAAARSSTTTTFTSPTTTSIRDGLPATGHPTTAVVAIREAAIRAGRDIPQIRVAGRPTMAVVMAGRPTTAILAVVRRIMAAVIRAADRLTMAAVTIPI